MDTYGGAEPLPLRYDVPMGTEMATDFDTWCRQWPGGWGLPELPNNPPLTIEQFGVVQYLVARAFERGHAFGYRRGKGYHPPKEAVYAYQT